MREKLVFGTAAIGLPYGLGRDGRPPSMMTEATANSLIKAALDAGITIFDTAAAYGLAEERLGLALGGRGHVWTKLGPPPEGSGDVAAHAFASVERSLKLLHRERLALLQWHNWTATLASAPYFLNCWEKLGSDPRIESLGASTYGVEDAIAGVESGLFGVVQVEWNLLNQGVVSSIARLAKERGVKVAIRSVLLQGALTDEARDLPEIQRLHEAVAAARKVARDLGIPLQDLALRAALDHDDVDFVLVGVDRLAQIGDSIRIANAGRLPDSVRARMRALSLQGDPCADPRTWGAAKPATTIGANPVERHQ